MTAFRLVVETRGGISDLGRVVDALSLYDLTPEQLSCAREGPGLHIEAVLGGSEQARARCLARVRVLPCVLSADSEPGA